jgi:hypothetical protein
MNLSARTLVPSLWAGLSVSTAGRALDLRWHATHDEFETANDQLDDPLRSRPQGDADACVRR